MIQECHLIKLRSAFPQDILQSHSIDHEASCTCWAYGAPDLQLVKGFCPFVDVGANSPANNIALSALSQLWLRNELISMSAADFIIGFT